MTRSKFNQKFRMSGIKSMAFVAVFVLVFSALTSLLSKNAPKPSVSKPDEITETEKEEIKNKYDLEDPKEEAEQALSPDKPSESENTQENKEDKPANTKNQKFDKRAKKGLMPGVSENCFDEVDKTKFIYIINKNMTIKKSGEEANVLIYNPKESVYNFRLELSLGNKKVFETELLAPGTYIESSKLDAELQKGEYTLEATLFVFEQGSTEEADVCKETVALTVEK